MGNANFAGKPGRLLTPCPCNITIKPWVGWGRGAGTTGGLGLKVALTNMTNMDAECKKNVEAHGDFCFSAGQQEQQAKYAKLMAALIEYRERGWGFPEPILRAIAALEVDSDNAV